MGNSLNETTAKPSKSVWHQALKLDCKGLFLALAKASLNASLQKWDDAAKDCMDAFAALGLKDSTPQQLAGLLLAKAMSRATFSLLRDYWRDFSENQKSDFDQFCGSIEDAIAQTEITLDETFLNRPREIALVPLFQKHIEEWLNQRGIRDHSPATIAARLPSYFVYALHQELRDNRIDYTPLTDYLEAGVSDTWRRERTWLAYQLRFERNLDEPVFGEGFGLNQIFIWPNAYYLKRTEKNHEDRKMSHEREAEKRQALTLKEALDGWLENNDKTDAIRIVSGDPGAGKSSFVHMYAAERMKLGDRVMVVPLHLLNVQDDLAQSIENFCNERDDCPTGLLAAHSAEPRLLLILDGLDELSKQGSIGASIAGKFVDEVLRTLSNRNAIELRLRVLISGRPIAIQNVTDKFRREAQVLYLLPYYIDPGELQTSNYKNYQYVEKTDLLKSDLRQAWWRQYGKLKEREYTGLPETLSKPHFNELTSQPLLNYLVALVYESKQIDFESEVSLNEIYAALLNRVYDRDWDPAKGHRAQWQLEKQDFRDLLEEMALTAWHDRERVTTVQAVRQRTEGTYLEQVLQEYEKHCDEGVGQLFAAFYFRKSAEVNGTEPTFEFTHKSFGEYLTACRIVDAVSEIQDRFEEANNKKRRSTGIWNEQEALYHWLKVTGPTAISRDLLPYIRNEISLRHQNNKETVVQWQSLMLKLIDEVLFTGIPGERLLEGLRFREMAERVRNAEEALLVLHSACATCTGEVSKPFWPGRTSAGDWIHRLRGQRDREYNPTALSSLNHLDFSFQCKHPALPPSLRF